MTASPFQKIIFPAILASSAVFAALTLPMSSLGLGAAAAPLPEPAQQWFSPLLQHEQKKVSIRYIGFSIISSVAAGVGTAELMRLRQNHRQRQQNLLHLLEIEPAANASQTALFEDSLSADQTSSVQVESDSVFNSSTPMNWLGRASLETLPAWPAEGWEHFRNIEPTEAEEPEDDWSLEALNAVAGPVLLPLNLPQGSKEATGVAPAQPLQRPCRVQLPGSERRVLALEIEGTYYSFFRLRPSREQALRVAATLEKQGQRTLVTPHSKGFAVWVQQLQAKVERLPQEQWQMIA